jgi:hypothetical protein
MSKANLMQDEPREHKAEEMNSERRSEGEARQEERRGLRCRGRRGRASVAQDRRRSLKP